MQPNGTNAGKARVRAYASPTAVLLAFDWQDGANHQDFLGFAIRRSPGYAPGQNEAFLFNKLGFTKAASKTAKPLGSDKAPIQKFLWWDGGIKTAQRGAKFTYTVTPVLGTGANDLQLQTKSEKSCIVQVPNLVDADGIGTYFNRAVVSSQSFKREFPNPTKQLDKAMDWLANGMQDAIPDFLTKAGSDRVEGAIYHLTDNRWIVPALERYPGETSLVYFWKVAKKKSGGAKKASGSSDDTVNRYAVQRLVGAGHSVAKRTKAAIMHDKFLVRIRNGKALSVLMGSANYTPEGLTSQANLIHTFESAALAQLYADRQEALISDPAVGEIAKQAGWSDKISVGNAKVRVFFPPEPQSKRDSLRDCIDAVRRAKRSVILCMFSPTDKDLLDSFFEAGQKGKLLYGLLNSISDPRQTKKRKEAIANGEDPGTLSSAAQVQVDLYNRSKKDHKILSYDYFGQGTAPEGFLPELSAIDTSSWSTVPKASAKGKKGRTPPAVHIHHKFVVIDAETDSPIIYTGSANMSNNSAHRNDENLLEITESPSLAQAYFAEFIRLYEHFRARAIWNDLHGGRGKKRGKGKAAVASPQTTLTLARSRDAWVKRAYEQGTPDFIARTTLAN
jgi:phosphatidylserine/phosphatidylglycerophosphate/cardiolipin synthase-like enzyme